MNGLCRSMLMLALAGCSGAAGAGSGPAGAPEPAAVGVGSASPSDGVYRAWVTSESADEVALVRFGGGGTAVERRQRVGDMPVEIDGPHGVAVSPDRRFVYVTIGHGTPFGALWKIDPSTGEVIARTPLGLFPATVSVTPDGRYGFVSNFNLHGDPVPSSISKVHLPTMEEVARIETCVMPHGSRVNPQGTLHYSVCMMDQMLVEIDVERGEVARGFSLRPGMEGPVPAPRVRDGGMAMDDSDAAAPAEVCSPTWAEPSADGASVFVTCNRARHVVEIDVESWRVVRRFDTGDAPYNLAATPDGRYLLVTLRNRTDPALEVHDLETGEIAERVPTSTTFVHGIAVTGDSRYAFVSVEGIGAEPGKVDVIDLQRLERVASVEVGQQATGIAVVP